ncbi:hypothetical protein RHP75_05645 [Pseudomonas sp. SG20056]|uniref:hypothetical protein n=1 Tax=Pseudomonas sp. SG20056 TaxID=3074146 RepID=UPI00287F7CAC|nr:hypothetical protein [Pseudomonas sp. SG20056]WNF47916.1 hypothetical protein RHP75_05645 [Pseudomonas sp. SG20056]
MGRLQLAPNLNAKAALTAKFSFLPRRSQIFVVTTILISAAAAFAGIIFQWYEKPGAAGPYSVAAIFALISSVGFLISHRNSDLADATQTQLRINRDEIIFSGDPRMPEHQRTLLAMSEAFAAMAHMRPLPAADGLIDSNGQPIPNSEAQAKLVIDAANEKASQLMIDSLAALGSAQNVPDIPRSVGVAEMGSFITSEAQMSGNRTEPEA